MDEDHPQGQAQQPPHPQGQAQQPSLPQSQVQQPPPPPQSQAQQPPPPHGARPSQTAWFDAELTKCDTLEKLNAFQHVVSFSQELDANSIQWFTNIINTKRAQIADELRKNVLKRLTDTIKSIDPSSSDLSDVVEVFKTMTESAEFKTLCSTDGSSLHMKMLAKLGAIVDKNDNGGFTLGYTLNFATTNLRTSVGQDMMDAFVGLIAKKIEEKEKAKVKREEAQHARENTLAEEMLRLQIGQARTAFEQGNAIVINAAEAYMANMKETVGPIRNTYGRALGAGPSTSRGFDPIERADRLVREAGKDDGEYDQYCRDRDRDV